MMDPGQPPRGGVPFSCNFDGISKTPSLLPPPGPHGPDLLNNNEIHLLDNFWENPNDVDPTFLSLPNGFEGLGASYGDSNFGWLNTSSAQIANNDTAFLGIPSHAASGIPAENLSSGMLGMTGVSSTSVEHSDDVWAAASLLHNNVSSVQNQQTGALNYAASTSQNPLPLSSQSYLQVPMPSSVSPYNMPDQSTLNGFYDPLQPVQPGNAYMPGIPDAINMWNTSSKRGPLRFGSDDNFSSRNYAAFNTEAPDRQLRATIVYNLEHADEPASEPDTQQSTTNNAERKRRRQSLKMVGTADSRVEDQSSEEEKTSPRRRRKARAKKELDKDIEDVSSRAKGSKRRQFPSPKKARGRQASATVSPEKRRKSSPIAGKAGRENLSEEQKRSNHIQSEQKRRTLIKQGFEDINTMVPELRPGGFSKSNMLFEAAKFMRDLQNGNDELRAQMESLENG